MAGAADPAPALFLIELHSSRRRHHQMTRSPLRARLYGQVVAGSLIAAALVSAAPALAQQPPVPTDFTAIVRQKMPAVVAITTKQRVEEQRQQAQSMPEDLPFREFFRRYYDERTNPRERQPRQS